MFNNLKTRNWNKIIYFSFEPLMIIKLQISKKIRIDVVL